MSPPSPPPSPADWRLAHGRSVSLREPAVMAIINTTPDSFFDGSRAEGERAVVQAAAQAVAEGAHILDVGGVSTRPGAQRVDQVEELRRVIPAIRAIRAAGDELAEIPISVDTTSAAVANAALDAGADAINDVSGGEEDPAMLGVAADAGCGVVLMHRLTTPDRDRFSDQYDQPPAYSDVVRDVIARLRSLTDRAVDTGVQPSRILWDPGLGFGKGVADTIALLRGTREIAAEGFGVLSGLSRKSFVGRLSLGRDSDPSERLAGTLALSAAHLHLGARVFRVHDVAAHREVLAAAWAIAAPEHP